MPIKKRWSRSVLSTNLKALRAERGYSQKEVSDRTDVSFRVIQEIESGAANPTLDTLHKIAMMFGISVGDLLSLSRLRLKKSDVDFLERFKKAFAGADFGVSVRSLDGVVLWGNQAAEDVFGIYPLRKGPVDLLECAPPDAAGLLRIQLAAEKNGICFPYTVSHRGPKNGELLFTRLHPTLILPALGKVPVFTAIYLSPISAISAENFIAYCLQLVEVVLGAIDQPT